MNIGSEKQRDHDEKVVEIEMNDVFDVCSYSTAYLRYAISISTIIVVIFGPILGAVADNKNHKKPLFTFFMMIGVDRKSVV